MKELAELYKGPIAHMIRTYGPQTGEQIAKAISPPLDDVILCTLLCLSAREGFVDMTNWETIRKQSSVKMTTILAQTFSIPDNQRPS